jgi:hypothetical protein
MTKDDLCNRCGHRRELHRPDTDWTWSPGDDGPCCYLGPHGGPLHTCHGGMGVGSDAMPCPSFEAAPRQV